jgi:hypothetical protein
MSTDPAIKIIAYVAANEIQYLNDDNKQISKYTRSFRFENHDSLVMRRLAFNRLLDEKESRMFGRDDNPDARFRGLSLYLEYLAPYDNGKNDTRELKKFHLLTGEPMSSKKQMERWEKELGLLRMAYPKIEFPVMPVSDKSGSGFKILETPYWTQMYYFYE